MPDTAVKKHTMIDAALDSIIGPTSDSDNMIDEPPPKRKRGPGKKNSELSVFFKITDTYTSQRRLLMKRLHGSLYHTQSQCIQGLR
jgi:hypothetical protein